MEVVEQGCESHMSGLVEAKYVEVEGGFTIQVCGGPDSHCAGAEPPGICLIVTHSQSHNPHFNVIFATFFEVFLIFISCF